MTDLGQLKYTYTLDNSGLTGSLTETNAKVADSSKSISGSLDETAASSDNLNTSFKNTALGVAAGQAIYAAAQAGFNALKDAITSTFEEADAKAQSMAQLNSVIQSTGGVAGVTSKMANELADSIQATTPIDDDAARSAENMLLTFTNIGSTTFPQATKAVTDMATAMNGGAIPTAETLSSTAIQVGKALNDPINGVTALRRVGVQLSDQQQQQVTDFVNSNNIMGAQNIILGELSREFGGSASAAMDTFAGKQAATKNTIDDAKASIGLALEQGLLPFQSALANFVSGDTFQGWIKQIVGAIQGLSKELESLGAFYLQHATIINIIVGVIGGLVAILAIAAATMGIVRLATSAWSDALAIWRGITTAATIVQAAFNAVMDANPIAIIILAIIALIAVIILIITHWKQVTEIFSGAGKVIGDIFSGVVKVITAIWSGITGFFTGLWNGIVAIFNGVVNFIKQWGLTILAVLFWPFSLAIGLIIANWGAISAFFQGVWNGIVAVFTPVVQFFVGIFQAAWAGIVAIWDFVVAYYTAIWDGIVIIFNAVVGFFTTIFTAAWNAIVTVFSPIIAWFGSIFGAAWNAIAGVFGAVGGFFRGVWNTITSIFTTIGTSIANAVGGAFKDILNTVFNGVMGIINGFIDGINGAIDLINKIPGVHIGKLGRLPVPHFAEGVMNFAGGAAVINENGGELVNLPDGSTVIPADQTAALMKAASMNASSGQNYDIKIVNPNYHFDTAESVDAYFNIGNRNAALEPMGVSPLAGTLGV